MSSMRAFSRTLHRRLGLLQSRRTVTTESAESARKQPSRIGGVYFQEGDRVIASDKDGKRYRSRLMAPLKPDGSTRTGPYSYEIKHSDIIGKSPRRLYINGQAAGGNVRSTTFKITHPSLDQFVSLAPRSVTPIYSSYGATIVDLLDIHVAPPLPDNDPQTSDIPRLEVLEAGTGNGGLTLHLARAIAAANPPPPHLDLESDGEALAEAWSQWKATRRAVVHTVEYEATRSRAAEKLIKSFRGALYWPHIDFHSGDVGDWVRRENEARQQSQNVQDGVFDIVVLDLPAVHTQIQHVVQAMRDNAQLVVWVPQITQVASCQHEIEKLDLPLRLSQVLELGEGISNGRRWDVRFVKTRAEQKKHLEGSGNANHEVEGESVTESSDSIEAGPDDHPPISNGSIPVPVNDFPTMVCRPMVGESIMGGGFVGLWRKRPRRTVPKTAQ